MSGRSIFLKLLKLQPIPASIYSSSQSKIEGMEGGGVGGGGVILMSQVFTT